MTARLLIFTNVLRNTFILLYYLLLDLIFTQSADWWYTILGVSLLVVFTAQPQTATSSHRIWIHEGRKQK